MADSTQPEPTPVQASFAAHCHAFHGTLPPEEQTLLEQVFALARSASQDQADVQGFAVGALNFFAVLPEWRGDEGPDEPTFPYGRVGGRG